MDSSRFSISLPDTNNLLPITIIEEMWTAFIFAAVKIIRGTWLASLGQLGSITLRKTVF